MSNFPNTTNSDGFSKIDAWREVYRWYTKWEQSLLLPRYDYLLDSQLSEIEEYLNISREEALKRCINAAKDNAKNWIQSNPETPQEVENFYTNSTIYIFDLMWWHSITMGLSPLRRINVLEFALTQGIKNYLDYGCGVGSTGILFAKHGLEVTLTDIGHKVLKFAAWRFKKRNLNVNVINFSEKLPKSNYELISAFDVLEHLVNIEVLVINIYSALVKNGYFVINLGDGQEESYPQHINHDTRRILDTVINAGFKLIKIEDDYYYFQKN